jgi:NADH:ubiquinone oxidoreductase subunit 4 (subunit M)
MEINLIALFLTPNLLLFYCFFEVVTFLMFIVLLNWGYEVRRSLASFYLFYYTFAASMLFLIGILSIYYLTDSLNFFFLQTFDFTDNQQILF